jgi:hypothetical protein
MNGAQTIRTGAKTVSAIRESVEAVELEILSRIPEEALEQAAETLLVLKDTLLEMAGGETEDNEGAENNIVV